MSLPTQTASIYRGDTFIADATYQTTDGQPSVLDGLTIEAYLLTKDNIELPIDVIMQPELGVGRYRLQADTDDWPLGRNQLIIRYVTTEGVRRTAQPVQLLVEPA